MVQTMTKGQAANRTAHWESIFRSKKDDDHSDVIEIALPPARFDVWRDRAVFHFLTAAEGRERYKETMKLALPPGGHAIIATFCPDAPPRCSGLEVVRYSPDSLLAQLGTGLRLLQSTREVHLTPGGKEQQFTYVCLQRTED